jgi:hypothetical protein
MTTRRDFLKAGVGAAAGIVFCSCGLQQAARAQQKADILGRTAAKLFNVQA